MRRDIAGAGQQLRCVDPDQRGGKNADGGENTETSTDVLGDVERWNSLGVREWA